MDNRSLTVDIRREVPGLHPGLNDLIRVLGKQAHCASRTLIVCEPVCPKPTYSESKYHKNCGSPKKGRSWDSLCRPSSLWSPVRPETYYYDCFFYRQYPDRDSEYQEIEEKYNAIKQQKLDYSPPECDEDQIKAIVSGVNLNKSGGAKYTTLSDMSNSSAGKGGKGWKKGGAVDNWSGPGTYQNNNTYGESSMGSARNRKYPPGSGSKRNIDPDGDSVPCAELAEIRDLLKKSDRETIRRMQEMLTLMKELSVRDICRATCDGSPPGGRFHAGGTKSARSEDDLLTDQESKTRVGQAIDDRKRKADVSGPKGSKKRYRQRGDDYEPDGSMKSYEQRDDEYGSQGRKKGYQQRDGQQRDSEYGQQKPKKTYERTDDDYDDYGPQGSNRSYQRRIDDDYGPEGRKKGYRQRDDYEPEGSMKSSQQRDDDYGPRQPKKSHQRDSDKSKRKRREYDDDTDKYDTVERGIPGEFDGEYDEDNAGSQLDLDIQEPRSLQRHLASTSRSGGKVGDDHESLKSSSSDRSRTSAKGGRPSSKRGKGMDRNEVPESSDTDSTGSSSSIYSESSTTDDSRRTKDEESDYESSEMDDFEAPGKASSSRSLKRHQDGSASSSQASLSAKGSATNMDSRKDRPRPGSSQEQKSPKQSRLPGSASSGAPDQPGSRADYKIPVGKKNVPLTVREVVELSNRITDVLVLEVINELIRRGLYSPPSTRYLQEPGATLPATSVEGSIKSSSSRRKANEQRAFDGTREPDGYRESRGENMKSTGSPTRLSRIDESSSRTGLSKEASRKAGSTRDMRQGEKRSSGESRRSSCPRHSKSLSPSTSSRRTSSSCRLEIERRAKSEGDRYKDTSRPGNVVQPKPWERRMSSQMKADSMRDSTKVQAKDRSEIPGSRGASMGSQRSKTGSYKPDSTIDGSYSGRQPKPPGSRQNLPGSSPRSTTEYDEVPPRDRPDMPGSHGASVSSQMSKTGSYRGLSTRSDQASLKDGSLPGRPPTLPGSRQNLRESSPRSTRQFEAPPQDRPGTTGSHGASISSLMSKTGSYRSQTTRPELASLKDGSLTGRPPNLPGSRQDLAESSPRSTRQYEAPPQDRSGTTGSRGASMSSQMSKTGSFKAPSKRSSQQASLKDGSFPGSRQISISSQMSKQSGRRPPSYGPEKTDSRREIQKGGSSRTRIEEPMGPGKVPSGPRIPKESSRPGILKEGSLPDRITEPEPLRVEVPLAPTFRSDKTSSSQRIIDPYISNQQIMMTEGEGSKGRVVQIIRPESINVYVPESTPTDARAATTSRQPPESCQPCEPDDFVATNYDTDNTTLYYARITNNAFPPVKETYHAAGFMLRSAYNYNIPPRSKINIKTDLLLQLPRNCYGRIAPRKCLVENYGIDVGADVIDRDYKGNITVVLFNHGDQIFTVERGNKVAQLICESIHLAKVVENNNLLK